MLANQLKGQNTARVTASDLTRWRVLDFGESYQIYAMEREFHDHNKEGEKRRPEIRLLFAG